MSVASRCVNPTTGGCCLVSCSERADITSSHAKAKKELQDMAEAMKVCEVS